jgi:hypothetical protein
MPKFDELNLKIRIRVQNPQGADAVCAQIAKDIDTSTSGKAAIGQTRLAGGGFAIPVISMERTDGVPLGMEAEFDTYWEETHCDGDDGSEGKYEARAAFFYGISVGRRA